MGLSESIHRQDKIISDTAWLREALRYSLMRSKPSTLEGEESSWESIYACTHYNLKLRNVDWGHIGI